jgi:ferredoxin
LKKIAKEKLALLWELLAHKATLYFPLQEDGAVNFAPWKNGAQVDFGVNSIVPPKNVFFPQAETYLRFKTGAKRLQLESVEPEEKFILFGVRPCDLASFNILDKIFLEEPTDGLYAKRRRLGTLVSMGCNEPGETCFCTSFALEPAFAPGADVMVWDMGEFLLWEPRSTKGEALTAVINELLDEAAPEETAAAVRLRDTTAAGEAAAARQRGWNTEGLQEALRGKFNDELWEKLYHRCLGCGICTYLCPTCHCFDIQDFSRDLEGERFSCWDSCMFAEFTLMTSGENPRPTQKERVRQRFLHKLLYFPSKFGLYACVGCGRCVRKCPVHLDITQVIKEAGGVVSGS